jgi:hypothetical protein
MFECAHVCECMCVSVYVFYSMWVFVCECMCVSYMCVSV